jgi:hypothetical protein
VFSGRRSRRPAADGDRRQLGSGTVGWLVEDGGSALVADHAPDPEAQERTRVSPGEEDGQAVVDAEQTSATASQPTTNQRPALLMRLPGCW